MATSLKHLYSLSLELPSEWIDWTAYKFRSDGAALRSITFALEPVPVNQMQSFLMERGHAVSTAFDHSRVGPLHHYPNPEFVAQGFDAEFGDVEPKQHVALVLLADGPESLAISAKAVTGYAQDFRHIVASVRRHLPSSAGAQPRELHRVYGYAFESPLVLHRPTQFAFAAPDDSARLSCEWLTAKPTFSGPEWSQCFVFPPDAPVTEIERSRTVVTGRAAIAKNGEALLPPSIERASAAAVVSGTNVELFWGEARVAPSPDAQRYLYLKFQSEHGLGEASQQLNDILSSMKWED